jgi:hypothetical protein
VAFDGKPGWEFHNFGWESFGLGFTFSHGKYYDNMDNKRFVIYFWVALLLGPFHVAYRFVPKQYGIRGVVK